MNWVCRAGQMPVLRSHCRCRKVGVCKASWIRSKKSAQVFRAGVAILILAVVPGADPLVSCGDWFHWAGSCLLVVFCCSFMQSLSIKRFCFIICFLSCCPGSFWFYFFSCFVLWFLLLVFHSSLFVLRHSLFFRCHVFEVPWCRTARKFMDWSSMKKHHTQLYEPVLFFIVLLFYVVLFVVIK